jgi:outer membrane protein assembly factor BamD
MGMDLFMTTVRTSKGRASSSGSLRGVLALAFVASAMACGRQEVDIATLASNSDQVIWQAGQKALKGKQWDVARQHFRRIVDGFPQSQLVPQARIAVGDTYFQEGGSSNMILAAGQYREFLTVFPSHPRGDYAQYQVAESFFNQKNSPDRDQTQVAQALEEYLSFLDRYPDSPMAKTVRERVRTCRGSLAKSEFVVAYFYQKSRRAYRAAIPRYEIILKNYPDFEQTDETLLRLGQCLAYTGRGAEAAPVLARLLDEYPESPFAKEARLLMAPAPAEAPAPAKK